VTHLAAVVLAGGAALRLGGRPKPALPVGGRSMLLRVLDAVAGADPRIVVGPPELAALLPPGVRLTRESTAGGGPVAGIAAGVRVLDAGAAQVAVVPGDLPFLTPTVVRGLAAGLAGGADVAVLVDDSGREQWLSAVWRRSALTRRLAALDPPEGRRVRDLVAGAAVHRLSVRVGSGPPPWFDCDTDDDLVYAEEWMTHDTG
jgi:molybdopterin-guanine dinucleotide biosynthesis protein A